MNSDNEQTWIKYVIFFTLMGVILGFCVLKLLKIILSASIYSAISGFVVPVFVIIALLIVLLLYNNEKSDTIE